MNRHLIALLLMAFGLTLAAAEVKFPGFRSTDRAALENAAKHGSAYVKLRARVRMAQIDRPGDMNTYAKQSEEIKKLMAELGIKDMANLYSMPLSTPSGKQSWPIEGWHAAHKAGNSREIWYLVNDGKTVRAARAEIGDAALFKRYSDLLKKHFSRYSPAVVDTALGFMDRLIPAVDPAQAATDFAQIRERVALAAEKSPEKWDKSLKLIDALTAKVSAEVK